jgi:hypothetical protein
VKEVKKVSESEMIDKEIFMNLVDWFTNLQRIKKAGNGENHELDYQIAITKAKLESWGINVGDLELK